MDPNHEIDNLDELSEVLDTGETVSVDDFIKELEAKERDLHITSDTSVIEIAESFDDADDMPELMRDAIAAKSTTADQALIETVVRERANKDADAAFTKLREQIEKMEVERDEMFKNSQRRARDFESYKTRTERERKETFQSQVGNLATQMLPALDNLNRALDFAGNPTEEKGSEFKQFFDGIVLVNQQVNEVFGRMGVTLIPTVGEIFDPQLHEAVATEVSDELPPNTISAELQRGYRMGEKIIRHSLVKVSQPARPNVSAARPPAIDADDAGHLDTA